jgi:nucleotide-binding universal stress UspA family protein
MNQRTNPKKSFHILLMSLVTTNESTLVEAPPAPQPQASVHEHVLTSEFEPKRVIVLPVDQSEASVHTIEWVIKNFGIDKTADQIVLLNARPFTVPDLAVDVFSLILTLTLF